MRKLNKLFIIFLSLIMAAGLCCISVFAETENDTTEDAEVKYTITVYSGKSGTFEDGSTVKVLKEPLGKEVTLNINTNDKIVVNNDVADKYYARGFKIAGHDNDELGQVQLVEYTFEVEGDTSFTVAYGMKGGLVKYTVNYVDESGNELLPSAEYYGMAGDTPVVSYQYVEGYKPDVYNIGRTLKDKDHEDENVFNFVYKKAAASGTTIEYINGGGAGANNANGAGAGAGNGDAFADGTTINDNPTPQASEPGQIKIEDSDIPEALPQDQGLTDSQRQLIKAAAIGTGCVVVLAIALAALLIKRRRDNEEAATVGSSITDEG